MVLTIIKVSPEEVAYSDSFKSVEQQRFDKRCLIYRSNCGIDGEGKTIGNKHYYTELQAVWPKGRRIIKSDDLGPHEIFDFLLHLPSGHNYVVYGASYDFNMWLRYLPGEAKLELCTKGETDWSGYHIKWIDRKYLELKRGNKFRIIYDVLAWYQKPFVTTLKDWDVGTPQDQELITRMKEMRGNFANVPQAEIEAYCWLECEYLVELTNKLCQAIQETPYRPRALYGPGALAEAIFRYHKIKEYHGAYDEELSLYAYYGGRFDTALFGRFERVFEYDIRSAYPDQFRYLPCLCHGKWIDSRNPSRSRHGLYRVKWTVDQNCPYPPFPYRDSKGCIWYPYTGHGWYHADEVRAAVEVFGNAVRVIEGKAFVQECSHEPFSFVENLYKWRLQLAKENYAKGQVVKLGLNSMYGKTAQSVGSHNKKPPFQNFFWAGAITAGTRAKILRVIGPKMDQIISIATDGIVSLEQLQVVIGEELGEWEYSELLEHVQVSNGVYHSVKIDGKPKERARGIGHGEIDWKEIDLIYHEKGVAGRYIYTRKSRFISIREASHLKNPDLECTWQSEERRLEFQPTRTFVTGLTIQNKEPPLADDDLIQFRASRFSLADLVDMKRVHNKSCLSYPFRKKGSWQEQLDLRDYYKQYGQQDKDLIA